MSAIKSKDCVLVMKIKSRATKRNCGDNLLTL